MLEALLGEHRRLGSLLGDNLLGRGLRLHLLSQQRDVFDRLQLRWVPKELVAVPFALHLPQDVHTVVVPAGRGSDMRCTVPCLRHKSTREYFR